MSQQLVAECGACKKRFAAQPRLAGKKVNCPACGVPLVVPELPEEELPVAKVAAPAAKPTAPAAKPTAPAAKPTAPVAKAPAPKPPSPPAEAAPAPLDDLFDDLGPAVPPSSPLGSPLGASNPLLPARQPDAVAPSVVIKWDVMLRAFDSPHGWTFVGLPAVLIVDWTMGENAWWTGLWMTLGGLVMLLYLYSNADIDFSGTINERARWMKLSFFFMDLALRLFLFMTQYSHLAWRGTTIFLLGLFCCIYPFLSVWFFGIDLLPREFMAWAKPRRPQPKVAAVDPPAEVRPNGAVPPPGIPQPQRPIPGVPENPAANPQGNPAQPPASNWTDAVDPSIYKAEGEQRTWELPGKVNGGWPTIALARQPATWAAIYRENKLMKTFEVYDLRQGPPAIYSAPVAPEVNYFRTCIRQDGALVARVGPGGLELVEVKNGGRTTTLRAGLKPTDVDFLGFIAANRLLMVGEDTARKLRCTVFSAKPEGEAVDEWFEPGEISSPIRTMVATSPGGKYMAIIRNSIHISHLLIPTHRRIGTAEEPADQFRDVPQLAAAGFSPDGEELSVLRTGKNAHLITWSMRDGRILRNQKLIDPPGYFENDELIELADRTGWFLPKNCQFIARRNSECIPLKGELERRFFEVKAVLGVDVGLVQVPNEKLKITKLNMANRQSVVSETDEN